MFRSYFNAIANYVNFTGVATRSQFWWFLLQNFILTCIIIIIGWAVVNNASRPLDALFYGLLILGIYGLFMLLPTLAISTRRLRDAGFSVWWFWGYVIFSLIFILSVQFFLTDNRYYYESDFYIYVFLVMSYVQNCGLGALIALWCFPSKANNKVVKNEETIYTPISPDLE